MPKGPHFPEAELFFRAYLHTTVPLHAALVRALCDAPAVPLELATVLEDIGNRYIGLAENLNAELTSRDRLADELEADDIAEARVDVFLHTLISGLGKIELHDGTRIDARRAIESFPAAFDAFKTAILIERAG